MSGATPTQTCELCGRRRYVTPDGRGFPPDIAKRKLQRACKANGCPCKPRYTAGIRIGGPITGQTTTPAATRAAHDGNEEAEHG